MKTYPLLFSDDMARAIVAGRKDVTRRPMHLRDFGPSDTRGYEWHFRDRQFRWHDVSTELLLARFAPCATGDLMIGRECWRTYDLDNGGDPLRIVRYRATHGEGRRQYLTGPHAGHAPHVVSYSYPSADGPWRPSIHMPLWAARIRRTVVSVTVERLQDITEADAVREGFASLAAFIVAWDAIYSARGLGWASNCYVWRIEFEGLAALQAAP